MDAVFGPKKKMHLYATTLHTCEKDNRLQKNSVRNKRCSLWFHLMMIKLHKIEEVAACFHSLGESKRLLSFKTVVVGHQLQRMQRFRKKIGLLKSSCKASQLLLIMLSQTNSLVLNENQLFP